MDKINHINKSISRHAYWGSLFRGIYVIRKNIPTLIGIGLFLSLLLMCIFAPWLAPYPKDAGDTIHLYSLSNLQVFYISVVQTKWDGIFFLA